MMNKQFDTCEIVHIPEKEPHDLHNQPTEFVFASAIDPQNANHIVRRLNQIAPLENLRHVKRIQKKVLERGQVQLSVILCAASEGDNQLDSVPPALQELISSFQLSPFITKVCKYAATSKEEWQEQCKIWPTSYHPRTYNIDGITGFSDENSECIFKFMQSAMELATSDGVVVNAAVIVDPSAKQIISRARDQVFAWSTNKENSSIDSSCNRKSEFSSSDVISNNFATHESFQVNESNNQLKQPYTGVACLYPWQWAKQQLHSQSSYYCHPLRHAAMVAVESSAARDRYIFPSEENNGEKPLELDHENPSSTSSPAKRQKTVCTTVENDDDQLKARNQSSNQLLERPYLCTGYDIYLVWEPCTMCAMALVHQRIRRIFYAFPNRNAGALGSVHRLQGEKSLNHHYAVFRVLLPEEALHKCHTEVPQT
ncbi:tRNA-specific adenosine deaminase TAD3-like [Arachis duranensis]|uniref:tRNA-specific adenosine deaminase TAD3 n=1 Tax=Arachis duranensis TaxID=130453 RepID=A0A6P4BDQ6_ARADU|nr:tRNA-specific adenosine deaminase TAD3 [Arachis duranensis]XP_052108940.1 tRNA-specific adenosine deaminase TAD3-like [Arachis duranensis]